MQILDLEYLITLFSVFQPDHFRQWKELGFVSTTSDESNLGNIFSKGINQANLGQEMTNDTL